MLLKRAGPHKSDGIHPLEIRMLMSMKALQNRNHPNEKMSLRKNNLLLLIRSQHSYFIRPESGHSPKFPTSRVWAINHLRKPFLFRIITSSSATTPLDYRFIFLIFCSYKDIFFLHFLCLSLCKFSLSLFINKKRNEKLFCIILR